MPRHAFAARFAVGDGISRLGHLPQGTCDAADDINSQCHGHEQNGQYLKQNKTVMPVFRANVFAQPIFFHIYAVNVYACADEHVRAGNQTCITQFGLHARSGFFKGVEGKAASGSGLADEFPDKKHALGILQIDQIFAVGSFVDGDVDSYAFRSIGKIIPSSLGKKRW